MKKQFAALSLLLVFCLSLFCLPARAENPWNEDYYRASDTTGELSDAEQDSLDEDCIAFVEQYRLDLVLVALREEDYAGTTLQERAEEYYDSCGFGYGEGHDGFLWAYDTDAGEVTLFTFGAAEGVIAQDYIERVTASAPDFREEHGVFGVLYSGIRYLSNYLDEHPGTVEGKAETARSDSSSGLPAWYPADPKNFPFYHDEAAPRVVDSADLFTDAEEQRIEARITELRQALSRDIVIYTDKTDYGLGKDILAADFYDFNGYGYGDEREGICLFIDMDPADRGWWACCTGSKTMGLYTESVANAIDDVLYEYLASGAYAEGVSDWVENVATLYRKGAPFVPEWYPDAGETLTPHHDPDAPRVVDELGVLSEAELSALSARAAEISRKYNVDVAIHTMTEPYSLSLSETADLYYTYRGYGFGDSYDGIMLTIFKQVGYYGYPRVNGYGAGSSRLSETNQDRMKSACRDKLNERAYFAALSGWLDQTEHMLRTGRVPRSSFYWGMVSLFGVLAGSAVGGISLGRAKARMRKPVMRRDANSYIGSDSRIADAGRYYLYTTTSRHYDPPREKSSGSSGGGRSSYSGSYSGSSGSSHSGSGRSF